MNFKQAFDPFRALSESWRLLCRAPVVLLVGGILLFFLTDGDESAKFDRMWEHEGWIPWSDFPEFFLYSLIGAFSAFVQLGFFFVACFLGNSFAGAITRVMREGWGQTADLLDARGRFGKQVLASLLAAGCMGLAVLPLWGMGALVLWLGNSLGMDWIASVGILAVVVIWLPVFAYIYLGLQLVNLAVAIEGLDPIAALSRSWTLVEGNRLWMLFYLIVTYVFAALGVLLCCVGVLLTGSLRMVALNESYLRLVTPEAEQANWWVNRGDAGGDESGYAGIDAGGEVVDATTSDESDLGADEAESTEPSA